MRHAITHRETAVVAVVAAFGALFWLPCAAQDDDGGPFGRLRGSMEKAEALLRRGVTGRDVADVQWDVVRQLDALIAGLEEEGGSGDATQEGDREATATKPSGATGLPLKPAEESILSPGGWTPGVMRPTADAAEAWLPRLPAIEQQKVLDTFSAGRLPPRYRELLRQYNKRLAEDQGG